MTGKTPGLPEPVVFERDGKALANGRDVAAYFGKQHQHVMRVVRKLIAAEPGLNRSTFGLVETPDEKNELRPSHDMDRDGFTLLAMGFTGEKALRWKLKYIAAFNATESALSRARGDPAGAVKDENARFRQVARTQWTWGRQAAQRMWLKLGLPTVPAMFAQPAQADFWDRSADGEKGALGGGTVGRA